MNAIIDLLEIFLPRFDFYRLTKSRHIFLFSVWPLLYYITCVVCFVLQKDNNYQPYPMEQVRHISYQLCKSVKCESYHCLSNISSIITQLPDDSKKDDLNEMYVNLNVDETVLNLPLGLE